MDKQEKPSPLLRAVGAHQNILLGEREALLTDLQVIEASLAGEGSSTFSETISSKLNELAILDTKIDTVKKYFSQNEEPKENPVDT